MPRPRKSSAAVPSNAFIDALKFCALICKEHGTINETHAVINGTNVTTFNGVLAMGCVLANNFTACPQIKLAIEALSKCGQNIAILQLDNNLLSIKSDKFKAIIPCIANELMQPTIPDPPLGIIDERLKAAFDVMIDNENGQDIYSASILLNGETLISSFAGKMIIEHWHGIDLPRGLAIPKALLSPLSKINKKLTKFGFSQWSITLYFEDDSWIKSQLYSEQWSNISNVFECQANLQPFPVDFWKALAAVSPFGEGLVYFHDGGKLSSHSDLSTGAVYDVAGMVGSGLCYPAKQLGLLQAWSSHVDFQAQGVNGTMLLAQGKVTRAVIAGVRQEPIREPKQPVPYVKAQRHPMDDNIPF